MEHEAVRSEPEQARRTLWTGVLVFRVASFGWMVLANVLASGPLRRPALAWTAMALTGAWTLWLARNRERGGRGVLWLDLAVSCALVIVSGLVAPTGGNRLFFATTYPASTALAWGAARGWPAGLFAGGALSVALFASRIASGYSLPEFGRDQILSVLNGIVYYLLAGGAAGVVSRALDRSAVQLRSAVNEAIQSRERAARLAEREALARAIHDSVLQALALIAKWAKELGAQREVAGSEVLRLGEMAREQEETLRAIVIREPSETPQGASALRDALEAAARSITALPVTVSTVGPIWLPAGDVDELAAAVRQALDNVVEHSGASRAAIFADAEDGWITVSVRDDGCGFVFEEDQLRAAGKAGMLKSMKGRILDLGGRMRVESAPGAGTEVQFRIPSKYGGVST
jgi:signal transduction histidine kinase